MSAAAEATSRCSDCGTGLGELHRDGRDELLCLGCYLRRDATPALRAVEDDEGHRGPEPQDRYTGRRYEIPALIAKAQGDIPYRVEPIAVDAHLTMLAATGGEGKTLVELALAGGVDHGAEVAGLRCSPGPVVIFDAENGEWVLGDRLGRMNPSLRPERVHIYNAAGLRLHDVADPAWMARTVREHNAKLVAWDPLRALTPGVKENDSDEMAPAVIAVRDLCRDTGAAGLLLHHRDKARERDFRGSGAIQDQVDMLFVLERPDKRHRRRLRCSKNRVGPEPEDRWLSIKHWRGQIALMEAAAPTLPGRSSPKRDELAIGVLEIVDRLGPVRQPTIGKELNRDKSDSTLRAALDHLKQKGEIVLTGDGYTLPRPVVVSPDDHPDHQEALNVNNHRPRAVVTGADDHHNPGDHRSGGHGGHHPVGVTTPDHDHHPRGAA
jgi:hypothetical protein